MRAAWMWARVLLRRRVAATVLLALLVGVTGATVLAALAAASRGRAAFPELLSYNESSDATVGILPSLPLDEQEAIGRAVVDQPEVGAGGYFASPLFARVRGGRTVPPPDGTLLAWAPIAGTPFRDLDRPVVLDGRLPDPDRSAEIAVNERFARRFGVGAGDTVAFRAYGPEQLEAVGNGEPVEPTGPQVRFTVTGVFRRPADVASSAVESGTLFEVNATAALLSPAFWARYGDEVATYPPVASVRLRAGASVADLRRRVRRLAPERTEVFTANSELQSVPAIRAAIDRQSNGLVFFAGVAAVAALVLVGQILSRQFAGDPGDLAALQAIGLTRRQVVAAGQVRAAPVAVGGALLAVAIAIGASASAPLGIAHRAELHPGVDIDGVVLGLGAVVIVVTVLARAAFADWLTAPRRESRSERVASEKPSRIVEGLARSGARPAVVTGLRMAVEPGRGRTAVPVRTAFAAAIVGVVAIAAAMTYRASLDHLLHDPQGRGWNWDAVVGNYSQEETSRQAASVLAANPDVGSFSGQSNEEATVDGDRLVVATFEPGKGSVTPPVLDGRLPRADHEIALGPETLADLDKEVGNRVRIAGAAGEISATIVGTAIGPTQPAEASRLGRGALVTPATYERVIGEQFAFPVSYVVRLRAGVDRAAAMARLRADFHGTVREEQTVADVDNLRDTRSIPYVLAAFIGALGLASIGNSVLASVQRRQRDFGVLKALGFTRGQVRAMVLCQAATFATVALVVGIPLGIVVGRWLWAADASLGVPVHAAVPIVAVVSALPIIVLLAAAMAVVPARQAAHLSPARALRAE